MQAENNALKQQNELLKKLTADFVPIICDNAASDKRLRDELYQLRNEIAGIKNAAHFQKYIIVMKPSNVEMPVYLKSYEAKYHIGCTQSKTEITRVANEAMQFSSVDKAHNVIADMYKNDACSGYEFHIDYAKK